MTAIRGLALLVACALFTVGMGKGVNAPDAPALNNTRNSAADEFLAEQGQQQVFFDFARLRGQGKLRVEDSARAKKTESARGDALRVEYSSGNHWGAMLTLAGRATPGEGWMLKIKMRAAAEQLIQINILGKDNRRFSVDGFVGNGAWQEAIFDLEPGMPSPVTLLELQAVGGQGDGWFEVQSAEFLF